MKTYLADIIPKIQQYSQKLDNLTLLTNHHWVVFDDINSVKNVYIFRSNNELLVSVNGKVEKGKWEYIGNNSLLIDLQQASYLFRHGFFDENILALKIDGKDEYAFLINESKYVGELNSYDKIIDFLKYKYITSSSKRRLQDNTGIDMETEDKVSKPLPEGQSASYKTKQGLLKLTGEYITQDKEIIRATLDGKPAPDGRYKLGFMWYAVVKNGIVV